MGQGQSSNSTTSEAAPAKTDYYELLSVERTATDEEIKKAYRRKALELHPDRNYGNVDNATALFAEVQTAYEVLSDPQERAWYDSHRDVLLRGDKVGQDGADEFSYNIRMTTTDEVLKLMMKFNGKLEFTDGPNGFYGGLHDFFGQLAKEENIACQWEDQDPIDYPEFGLQNDSYEEIVRPFYAAWTGFATRKSYAWKDHYRLSDAPDRRIRRLMEKENKKLREEAVQEYNDAVRSLVAFVRKRDPRIQNNQKSEAERQKILREAAAAQAARSRAARQARLEELDQAVVPEWAQSRTKDAYEGGFSSESDVEEHEYDCVVCDKTFKSEAQFHAHEKSKKHIKLLKQLKKDMQAEGEDFDLDSANDAADLEAEEDDEQLENKPHRQGEAHKPTPARLQDDDSEEEEESDIDEVQQSIKSNLKPQSKVESPDESDDSDDDYAPRSKIEHRLTGGDPNDLSTKLADSTLEGTPATSDGEGDRSGTPQPKIGKAKLKKAKKAAKQAAGETGTPTSEFRCAVCQAEFPSKTKLFSHIKDEKHAALKTEIKATKGGKGKKK